MRDMLSYWFGWSMGAVAFAEHDETKLVGAIFALASLIAWTRIVLANPASVQREKGEQQ